VEACAAAIASPDRRLSENGYFSQSLRQAQIIILEILQCITVVIIFAFLDLENTISFSDSLLRSAGAVPDGEMGKIGLDL